MKFSDLLVKIVHVNDTTRVSLLSDNTKSVRSATWDPSGRYLVGRHREDFFELADFGDNGWMRWQASHIRYIRCHASIAQDHGGSRCNERA